MRAKPCISSDFTDVIVIKEVGETASTNMDVGMTISAAFPMITTFEMAMEVATGPVRSTTRFTFGNTVCATLKESVKTKEVFLAKTYADVEVAKF